MFLSSHLILIPPTTNPIERARNNREYSVYSIPDSSDM